MTLAGKVALVTGATRGTGRAVAGEFGAHGARLVLTGRSTDGLSEIAGSLRGEVATVALDLTAPGAPEAAVEAAPAHWGCLAS